MDTQRPERLRQHPEQRFAGSRHQFDLAAEAQNLAGEVAAGQGGHRQQSLYKHGPTSVSLFLFERLTRLSPHRTKGIVMIHVLSGYVQVTADGEAHDLRAGGLLVLAPEVQHGVVAYEESQMLLTVTLEPATNGAG